MVSKDLVSYFDNYISSKTKLDLKTNCLEYTGIPMSTGYAQVNNHGILHTIFNERSLHRAIYVRYFGKIPSNLCVMHICDNRKCLNINHLKLGTLAENNTDRNIKGRSRYVSGENTSWAKLNKEKVLFIKRTKGIFSAILLADLFNVSKATIFYIRQGKTWRHLNG